MSSNLSRVIADVDGVEFYTDATSGESGVSQSGLAILCGVTQQTVSKLIKSLTAKASSKWLEPIQGRVDTLTTKTSSGMMLCYDELCVAVIKHYAFQGKEPAQIALDKFATTGFNAWVQSITGWESTQSASQPQPQPQPQPEKPKALPGFTQEQLDFQRRMAEMPLEERNKLSPEQIALMSGWTELLGHTNIKQIFWLSEEQQKVFHRYRSRYPKRHSN